jgi:hypothetical protein
MAGRLWRLPADAEKLVIEAGERFGNTNARILKRRDRSRSLMTAMSISRLQSVNLINSVTTEDEQVCTAVCRKI